MDLRIALLGPMQVLAGSGEPEISSLPARERAVLALLALAGGRAVTASRLIDELWPDDPPVTATNTVQVYISHLRRSIGRAALRTTRDGYLLDMAVTWVDVGEFESLSERGRTAQRAGRYAEAAELLGQALALWRGEPFGTAPRMPTLAAEAVRLGERRLLVLEDWVEALTATGSGRDLVVDLQGYVAEHPLRERLQAGLMTALYQAGRQGDALDAYAAHRARCVEELGMEPGPSLQRLQGAILSEDPSLAAPTATLDRLPPAEGPPAPATRLMARERELAELVTLVAGDARLVTVTGPGGVGKTRLLLECAHALSGAYADGVCWVPLAALNTSEELVPAIARALGLRPGGEQPLDESVRTVLSRRQVLLVLDNMEQLLPAAGALVSELVRSSLGVRLLVSSRVALHVDGEHRYPISPLPTAPGPPEAPLSSAGELFLARARAVRPQLIVGPEDGRLVNDICARLDGLPLALELAAARTNLLSLTSLRSRLDDRLSLVAHPRTLRNTVAWSYDLLPAGLQRLFRHLGVFSGGADLDAVVAVTGSGSGSGSAEPADTAEVLDSVAELVDASLVTVAETPDGEPRFTMLETIRAFADEQLTATDEAELVQRRHARHFVSLAQELGPRLEGAHHLDARLRLETDLGNFREALEWALAATGSVDPASEAVGWALDLCQALDPYWEMTGGFAEGRRWLDRAMEAAGELDSAQVAACLNLSANHAYKLGDVDRARESALSSVAMWHRLSDAGAGAAKALNSLAAIELERGNVEEAAPLYEEALAVARASGDRAQLEQVLSDLSSFEASRHNYRRCLEMDTEALGIARELGDAVGVLLNQQNLACTLRQMGRLDEAHDLMRDLVPQLLRYDVPASLTAVAEDFAAILAERGDHVLAVRLLGAADARRERLGTPRYALQQAEIAAPMAQSEKAMSPEEWHQAYQAGRIATVETALGEAAAHRVGPGPHAGP